MHGVSESVQYHCALSWQCLVLIFDAVIIFSVNLDLIINICLVFSALLLFFQNKNNAKKYYQMNFHKN